MDDKYQTRRVEMLAKSVADVLPLLSLSLSLSLPLSRDHNRLNHFRDTYCVIRNSSSETRQLVSSKCRNVSRSSARVCCLKADPAEF